MTPPLTIAIEESFGWKRASAGRVSVWAKGYQRGADLATLLAWFRQHEAAPSPSSIGRFLEGLDGHFAFAATGPSWGLAAVDAVRSIPLGWSRVGDAWVVHDQAEALRRRAALGEAHLNGDAALAIAMAGYTVDVATLYHGLHQLGPGECVVFAGAAAPLRHRYYCYRPWRADKPAYDEARARKALAERTLEIVDGMMKSIAGRELVVPLSAGRDSRLIVSAARHLGYRNVRCFAYGRSGNFESVASEAIAARLNYPWRFVASGTRFMRRYLASERHRGYMLFADTLQSAPFIQDLPQVAHLKATGFIPDDAVLCNGNSGDYISGAHVVPAMRREAPGLSAEERRRRISDSLVAKHFALWRDLATPANRLRISAMLQASIARAGGELGDPRDDYGLYEYAEFQDRQCKFVVTGQRIYEFLGHEWRLPLWAKSYLDFWEAVPLAGKAEQSLYASMLAAENWGGVWSGIPVNRKTIRPQWLRPIRLAAKLAVAPFGRDRWHRFERRFFQYWMSPTGATAIVPYLRAASDRRGARHGMAWLAENYLARHGIGGIAAAAALERQAAA